jgi:histidinol-phosphatase (PHP family)
MEPGTEPGIELGTELGVEPGTEPGMQPEDGHVHSQWSWDAPRGDMERTCARALELGLKSLAFTDHVDLTPWALHAGGKMDPGVRAHVGDGILLASPLDVAGYLESVQRCRELFPGLRVLSGLEISEPHLHRGAVTGLLGRGDFDRVLGSVHSLVDLHPAPEGGGASSAAGARVEISGTYSQRPALEVVRSYLAEVAKMAQTDMPFSVLAHIDYPLRSWPASAGPFRPELVEEEYRSALGALAASGRALEVNTQLHLAPQVVDWWHDEGGEAVTFGSDAHEPGRLAWEFSRTAAMVSAHGFQPGAGPYEMWRRV